MKRKDDTVDQPSGGETTWTNTGATRYDTGDHQNPARADPPVSSSSKPSVLDAGSNVAPPCIHCSSCKRTTIREHSPVYHPLDIMTIL